MHTITGNGLYIGLVKLCGFAMNINIIIGNDITAPRLGTVRAFGYLHRKSLGTANNGRRGF